MIQDRRCSMLRLLLASGVALAIATPVGAQQPATPTQSARPAQAPKPKPAAPKPATPKPATGSAAPAAKPAAAPAAAGAQPRLLGQYAEWGAYTAAPGGHKICFALAKPAKAETTPPNRPRDPAYVFVSSRPTEKVKDEVSIIMGYGFKPNSDATLEIGGASYAMYTQNDGAWIKNAAEESRLVEAMRKAPEMVVKGQSARGTSSHDVYMLKGLSQALDRADQECK